MNELLYQEYWDGQSIENFRLTTAGCFNSKLRYDDLIIM